jgi:hypothetical protein
LAEHVVASLSPELPVNRRPIFCVVNLSAGVQIDLKIAGGRNEANLREKKRPEVLGRQKQNTFRAGLR